MFIGTPLTVLAEAYILSSISFDMNSEAPASRVNEPCTSVPDAPLRIVTVASAPAKLTTPVSYTHLTLPTKA